MRLPDAVIALPEQEATEGTWMDGEDAVASVMLQVPGAGAFLRALLPVHLDGGDSVVYGVWVGASEEQLRGAFSLWWVPEYERLRIRGTIATSIEPWGLLGADVELAVLDVDHTPYCVSSEDTVLAGVLREAQDAGTVLEALP